MTNQSKDFLIILFIVAAGGLGSNGQWERGTKPGQDTERSISHLRNLIG